VTRWQTKVPLLSLNLRFNSSLHTSRVTKERNNSVTEEWNKRVNKNSEPANFRFSPGLVLYLLVIYNRWGEKIFESNDSAFGWDGTYNGGSPFSVLFSFELNWVCLD